jgi:hypothetical protein
LYLCISEIASVGLTEKNKPKRIQLKLGNSVLSGKRKHLELRRFCKKVILMQNTAGGWVVILGTGVTDMIARSSYA